MARKTAMKKEPTVSVALPNSEKERLGMPTRPPVRQQLQRLSPGVYRNQMGQLTSSTGRALPRRNPQPQSGNQIADAMNQQPQQRPEIATRPPAPLGSPTEGSIPGLGFQQQNPGVSNQPISTSAMTSEQLQQLLEWAKQQAGAPMPPPNMPSLPQPSANNNGQYRLSPGIYGSREQAMDQYARQFEQVQPRSPNAPARRFGY